MEVSTHRSLIVSGNPSSDLTKMHFVIPDNRSYPLLQLFEKAMQEIQNGIKELESQKDKTPDIKKVEHFSPQNNKYCYSFIYDDLFKSEELKQKSEGELLDVIKRYTLIDWSSTSQERDCSLTQDEYQQPYIMNINGRTYSKQAILSAFRLTLFQDKDLRLEDIVLQPSMLRKIKLYPNLTLWKDDPLTMVDPDEGTLEFNESMISMTQFDEFKAKKFNIDGFSEYLGSMPKDDHGMWDICAIYNWYANARMLPCYADNGETFENLFIRGIKFPLHHPKVNSGESVTFKNTLFENCTIDINCWCGLKVKSSQFVDCTFILPATITSLIPMTKFIRCTFTTKQAKGEQQASTFNNIERFENVLEVVPFVEKRENLIDCTFVRYR